MMRLQSIRLNDTGIHTSCYADARNPLIPPQPISFNRLNSSICDRYFPRSIEYARAPIKVEKQFALLTAQHFLNMIEMGFVELQPSFISFSIFRNDVDLFLLFKEIFFESFLETE
jgi:hypothetical protein